MNLKNAIILCCILFSCTNNKDTYTRDVNLYIRNDTDELLYYSSRDGLGAQNVVIKPHDKRKIFSHIDSYANANDSKHFSCAKLMSRFDSKLEFDSFLVNKDIYNDELWDIVITKNGLKNANQFERYFFTIREDDLIPK